MVKWPSGPRQVTANLYNRWFESNLHLQVWSRSLAVRISPCHGDGMGSIPVETAKFWRRSINGDALDCKSGALGTTGSIPVFSTNFMHPSSIG
jgi:hypothetical protein